MKGKEKLKLRTKNKNLKKRCFTFRTQLLLTNKFPGLISRCKILAECKYFSPEIRKQNKNCKVEK